LRFKSKIGRLNSFNFKCEPVSDNLLEVIKSLHDSQAKYTEYLLAAAGACIALSVARTTGVRPDWSMVLLAMGVLSWALSILAGVKNRQYFQSTLYANADLIKVQTGQHPECPNHPDYMAAAAAGISKAIEGNIDKASFYAKWQLRLLLAGAGFFLAWHITEMFIG
jgi:hypothetical protein